MLKFFNNMRTDHKTILGFGLIIALQFVVFGIALLDAQSAASSAETPPNGMLIAASLALISSMIIAFLFKKTLVDNISALHSYIEKLKTGDFKSIVPCTQSEDETGDMARTIDSCKEEMLKGSRAQGVLDAATSCIMMADADLNIIYMNESQLDMLHKAESDVKEVLPNFDVKNLIGKNIDIFHKNPQHQRSMLANLQQSYETTITVGKRTFHLYASPLFAPDGSRTGYSVEWVDQTEDLIRQAKETHLRQMALRFERSMDAATACVMMADADLNIVYMNEEQVKMMRIAEPDLKKELSQFDVDNLIGQNIDIFHKNPQHQRGMLSKLNSRYETTITVGPRTFDLVASPLFDEDGTRLGYSVEWIDKTLELSVRDEINTMINAANKGDLESRVSLEGKEGFFLNISEGVNNLASTMSNVANDLAKNLQALSGGDLTARITTEYEGIFKQLKDDYNETSERLTEIVEQIMSGSREISDSADEVTKGSGDLSNRTEQQASTLEETAASMEELTSTVKNNSENAKDANDAATKTRTIAEQGSRVANEAGDAMQKIAESSQKITEIITVIDEIAFQTNLLALNAAVEAARAGDAGRGFAVVAQEVRTLAQRSAQSSKDIKSLIDDSSKQVSEGVNLVKTAVESLQDIYTSIDNVSELVGQIASASVEQSTSLDEINQAVLEMDNMTQQNASMAQESKNVSLMMREKSYNLIELVEYFKTDSGQKSLRKAQHTAPPLQNNVAAIESLSEKKPEKRYATNGAATSNYMSGPEDAENDADWKEF
jgi:methyl-accepting chemotaxis protein